MAKRRDQYGNKHDRNKGRSDEQKQKPAKPRVEKIPGPRPDYTPKVLKSRVDGEQFKGLHDLVNGLFDKDRYKVGDAEFVKNQVPLYKRAPDSENRVTLEFVGAPAGHELILSGVQPGTSVFMSTTLNNFFVCKVKNVQVYQAIKALWKYLRKHMDGKAQDKAPAKPAMVIQGEKKVERPDLLGGLSRFNKSLAVWEAEGGAISFEKFEEPVKVLEVKKQVAPAKSAQSPSHLAEAIKAEEKQKKHKQDGESNKSNDRKILCPDGADIFSFEGASLKLVGSYNHQVQRMRYNVYVLSVPKEHRDYDLLVKLAGNKFFMSTFVARIYEVYPKEKLQDHLKPMGESLEALWRLLRRALGVTAPMGSAELKKVA